jgi:flagellar hook protein FlgE
VFVVTSALCLNLLLGLTLKGIAMSSISSTAASGMNTAQTRLNASAHNVANLGTEAFRRQEVVQTEQAGGGVSPAIRRAATEGAALEQDLVDQLQAKNSFLANLAVFKTSDKMAGALLDHKA